MTDECKWTSRDKAAIRRALKYLCSAAMKIKGPAGDALLAAHEDLAWRTGRYTKE